MAVIEFPHVETANEDGLLAIGGDLEVSSLLLAYKQGIFPWPISEEYPLAWFSPDPRGMIFYDNLHVAKSLKKVIRKDYFKVSFNQKFDEVVWECANAKNRKDGMSTWITEDIILSYSELFRQGYAYSVEVHNPSGELVGGVYGTTIGKMVSGESMFYKESNASKIALVYLLEHLYENDIHWLDTQMVTDVVESLGGENIARKEFISLLENVVHQQRPEKLFL